MKTGFTFHANFFGLKSLEYDIILPTGKTGGFTHG